MDLQEQIRRHNALGLKIAELEEERKALGVDILQRMQSATLQIPGYLVRRCSRLSIKLSIEEARSINAVRFEEVVDKDKIKALYKNGQPIKGVSEIHFIQTVKTQD